MKLHEMRKPSSPPRRTNLASASFGSSLSPPLRSLRPMTAPTLDTIVAEVAAAKPEEVHKDGELQLCTLLQPYKASSLTRLNTRPVVPLLKKLDKSSSSKSPHLLEGKLSDGTDPLEVLDPALHSVGYLFVLLSSCSPSAFTLNAS
jgi:hypothetical protein